MANVEYWASHLLTYLLPRHPLPFAGAVLLAIFALLSVWRGGRERLLSRRTAVVAAATVAVVGALIFFIGGAIYATSLQFLDHVEPNVVGTAAMFATGRPIYHAVDAAPRYALLYGPNLFIVYGTLLKLTGGSVPALKAFVLIGFAVSAALVATASRQRAADIMLAAGASAPDRSSPWLAAGYVVLAIASFGELSNLPVWLRAEPLLLLLTSVGLLAAVTMPANSGAAVIGVAAGLAINVKPHAPLYFVPIWFTFPHRWRIAALATGATSAAIVAVAPFVLFRQTVSFEMYLTWLRAAGKHGLRIGFLLRNLEMLTFVALPVIAMAQLSRDRRTIRPTAGATLASAVLVAVIGSKPGAGPWHLMPFVVPLGYVLARSLQTTNIVASATPSNVKRVIAAAGVAAFALCALTIASIQIPKLLEFRREWSEDRAVVAELRRIVSEHPGANVHLGVGSDDATLHEYELGFFRPYLVLMGQPYLLDYVAVMDMKLSGIPVPQATRDAIVADRQAIWLMPRGSRPFGVSSVYEWGVPVFDDSFRAQFDAHFRPTSSTEFFDLWTAGPAAR